MTIAPGTIVTGLDLSDWGGNSAVDHVVFTLLHYVSSGLADQSMWLNRVIIIECWILIDKIYS